MPVYRPRDAEHTVLHQVIGEHLETFLHAAAEAGSSSRRRQAAVCPHSMPLNRAGCRRPVRWLLMCAVASAPGGFLEGRCLRMADYVRGRRATWEATARAHVLMLTIL